MLRSMPSSIMNSEGVTDGWNRQRKIYPAGLVRKPWDKNWRRRSFRPDTDVTMRVR
jgi:hypothetical protein